MTRNRLFMRKDFPESSSPLLKMIIMDILYILVIEDDKLNKLIHMGRGMRDYLLGRMGPIDGSRDLRRSGHAP